MPPPSQRHLTAIGNVSGIRLGDRHAEKQLSEALGTLLNLVLPTLRGCTVPVKSMDSLFFRFLKLL